MEKKEKIRNSLCFDNVHLLESLNKKLKQINQDILDLNEALQNKQKQAAAIRNQIENMTQTFN